MDESRAFTAGELRTGLQAEFEREITVDDVTSFAELSGDWNPLHTDEAYAAQTNYGGRIVHGAFQVALASAMAGYSQTRGCKPRAFLLRDVGILYRAKTRLILTCRFETRWLLS